MRIKDAKVHQIVHQVRIVGFINRRLEERVGVTVAVRTLSGGTYLKVLPLTNATKINPDSFQSSQYEDIELWHATKLDAVIHERQEVETKRKAADRHFEKAWNDLKATQQENEERALSDLQWLDELEQREMI
jgi:hypothetical protein